MSVNIELEDNMSLQEVAAMQDEGFSVLRSAHVGNARGYNLAVASVGIPMLLVDHNIATQTPDEPGDRNYLPGSIVTREGLSPLALSSYGGIALQTQVEGGQYLDVLHMDALRSAFPATNMFTNTQYVRNNESIAGQVAAVALERAPQLFSRVVESDGKVRKAADSFAGLVESYGLLQLNDNPRNERGVLLPNEVDILINFIVEALGSGRDTQYHLSGPDMQNYIKDRRMRASLDALYAYVREEASFGPQLPEDLNVKLVPSDAARFVTTKDRTGQLYTIFDWLAYAERVSEERRDFFTSDAAQDPEQRETFIQEVGVKTLQISEALGAAVLDASEIFVPPQAAPYVSQHDVIKKGLLMPAQNTHLPLRELRSIGKRLDKIREVQ
jgi:hypothetical protein